MNICKEQFIKLLDERYTNDQLATYYNCSIDKIKLFKKDNSLIGYKTNKKPLTNKQLDFINFCIKTGKSFKETYELLGVSSATLRKYIPKSMHDSLIFNSKELLSNKHRIGSLEPFLNPTIKTAYFIGLLQSDGNISDDGCVKLACKDRELVQEFAKFIGANIIEYKGVYSAQVKDFKLTNKFIEVTNIVPRKTYTEYKIPQWIYSDIEYMYSFITGVFNGDGSVAFKRIGHPQLQIEQHSSQFNFLKHINEYLNWNLYSYEYAKIQTSSRDTCLEFYERYSNNEYALIRKVLKLEELLQK